MSALTVLRPGLLASVQDLGRHGHRQRGICPGGALDALALDAGQSAGRQLPTARPASSSPWAAARSASRRATRIALAGDDFGARLDGAPLWPCWSVPVQPGQVLRLGRANEWSAKAGLRSWLAVAGGIDVPPVIGSRSTDLKAGFGGHQGRALKKGDRLPLGAPSLDAAQPGAARLRPARARHGSSRCDDGAIVLRVMPGPEFEQFTLAAREQLWREPWRITPQSNRMGSRLEGRRAQAQAQRRHAVRRP